MSDAMNVYLHDHLAGAGFAIDLLEFMSEKYRDNPLEISPRAFSSK